MSARALKSRADFDALIARNKELIKRISRILRKEPQSRTVKFKPKS